ncbi:hypothetical protein TNCT_515231 [Trichonephila clavata]|uniref:RNase H type-1 domain-containing protein n=1 Tax=Trichonephila clavata TaxID=2740835 RepID=A0A8X6FJ67_TRICU|nr:hypothetical protein TNCT_515231 [Trichonephila clavata]
MLGKMEEWWKIRDIICKGYQRRKVNVEKEMYKNNNDELGILGERQSVVDLAQLHCHLNSFTRAVALRHSKAAIFATNSNSTPASSNILDCKKLLQGLTEFSKQMVLQWIPGHCGVTGNELVDHLAKKEASIQ